MLVEQGNLVLCAFISFIPSRTAVSDYQDPLFIRGKMKESTKQGIFSFTGAVIVLCSVGCEIGKQISNYSINYYNGGSYPLPQTILVRLRQTNIKYCLVWF